MQVLAGLLAAVLLGVAGAALACPACVPTAGPTIAQRLAAAESVLVVARSQDDWFATAHVKGTVRSLPPGALRSADSGAGAVVAALDAGGAWDIVGAADATSAPWLAAIATASEPDGEPSWRQRVAHCVSRLEDGQPLVAEIAYQEVARAPYEAMRAQKEALDARRIAGWLDDPARAPRASLYTLLLGIAGGPQASARIAGRVATVQRERDVTDLAALLVADMELHGVQRVAWIEKAYLSDRGRSAAEVQAVLVALQVQGGANAAIPRARAVDAYRRFIRSGNPLAGYAAPVLLSWQAWDAVPDYVALLRSNAPQHPASTIAMLDYLDRSPGAQGKAAASAYRRQSR